MFLGPPGFLLLFLQLSFGARLALSGVKGKEPSAGLGWEWKEYGASVFIFWIFDCPRRDFVYMFRSRYPFFVCFWYSLE